jgi:hypothetical protein
MLDVLYCRGDGGFPVAQYVAGSAGISRKQAAAESWWREQCTRYQVAN